jgi:hypothetical protein
MMTSGMVLRGELSGVKNLHDHRQGHARRTTGFLGVSQPITAGQKINKRPCRGPVALTGRTSTEVNA